MRRVIGYTDTGSPIWSPNEPSYARLPSHGGSLVVAPPKPARNAGLTPTQRKPEPSKVEAA